MNRRLVIVLAAPVMGILLWACGTTLNRHQARKILLAVPDFAPAKKDFDLLNVSQMDANHAVVDVGLRLTVLLAHQKTGWEITEVKLGDGSWEKVATFSQAMRDGHNLETRRRMLELVQGLLRYFHERKAFPEAEDITRLTDQIHPRYLPNMVRTDAWGTDFQYRTNTQGSSYILTSAGPDRRFGDTDDIVLVDGCFSPIEPGPGFTHQDQR